LRGGGSCGGEGGRWSARARWTEAGGVAGSVAAERNPGRLTRAPDRRVVGCGAAGERGDELAGVRLAAAQVAAARRAADTTAWLCARGRAGAGRPAALRAAAGGSPAG